MYQVTTEPFGQYRAICCRHLLTGEAMHIIPEMGAMLNALHLRSPQGVLLSLIWGAESPAELSTDRWFRSSLLFPFPNRVAGGQYPFEGQTYQLPLNEPARQAAIHGFLSHVPWQLAECSVTHSGQTHELDPAAGHELATQPAEGPDRAVVRLAHGYAGSHPGYPFPFRAEVTYSLSTEGLELTLAMINTGEGNLPAGMGWHPYFHFTAPGVASPQGAVNDYQLQINSDKTYLYDSNLTPLARQTSFDQFLQLTTVGDTFMDNCFELVGEPARVVSRIHSPIHRATIEVWQDCGPQQLNYTQVFTLPERHCLAIEPMSCAPNAFNNGYGLVILPPDQRLTTSMGVGLG